MITNRIKAISIFLGIYSLIGLVFGAACLNGVIRLTLKPKNTEIILFLSAIIPFGFCAVMMSNIGFNSGGTGTDANAQNMKFLRRLWEVIAFFPLSFAAFVLTVACITVDANFYAAKGLKDVLVVLVFFSWSAFVELRLLPAGDRLIESWARQDSR